MPWWVQETLLEGIHDELKARAEEGDDGGTFDSSTADLADYSNLGFTVIDGPASS